MTFVCRGARLDWASQVDVKKVEELKSLVTEGDVKIHSVVHVSSQVAKTVVNIDHSSEFLQMVCYQTGTFVFCIWVGFISYIPHAFYALLSTRLRILADATDLACQGLDQDLKTDPPCHPRACAIQGTFFSLYMAVLLLRLV